MASELAGWLVSDPSPFTFMLTVLPVDLGLSVLMGEACDVRHVNLLMATVRRVFSVSSGGV